MVSKTIMKRNVLLLLSFITASGAFLRILNLSPFTFYPDSYQSLIGAMNIVNYHSVLGYLGPLGMLYPDFFMWTHPGYPLLIIILSFFTHDFMLSAHIIALLAGIIAIPLSYLYLKSVFRHPAFGLAGALLIAISYQHTIWSGFIMTETLGVLLTLLFLWNFFRSERESSGFMHPSDVLSGCLLAAMILTRYEYAILLVPILFYGVFLHTISFPRLMTIFSAMGLILSLTVTQLFPIQASLSAITHQLPDLLSRSWKVLLPLILLTPVVVFLPPKPRAKLLSLSNKAIPFLLVLGVVFLLGQMVVGPAFPLFYDLTLIRNFFLKDFFITSLAVVGLLILIRDQQQRKYAYFVLISCLLLIPLYHRVNPTMDRYMTHIIPFLLLPAGYALGRAYTSIRESHTSRRTALALLLIVAIVLQGVLAYRGLRYGKDTSWMREAYQDKAARIVSSQLTTQPDLLIASFPEPYYFLTGISTQSIADKPPYIFLDKSFDDKRAVIIVDEGMHDIFPHFTKLITKDLQIKPISSFWVQEQYHFSNRSEQEKYPVIMLEVTVKELKKQIQTATSLHKR